MSLKEIVTGDGPIAQPGLWVAVHYTVTLVGDGTVLEETQRSGLGDRDYGQPLVFELGAMSEDSGPLRALHACVLDMRKNGCRRVRTQLGDSNFGYRHPPRVTEVRNGELYERRLKGEWLIDVEVKLESVSENAPVGWPWVLLPARLRFWS